MENFPYLTQPVCCIITGTTERGKSSVLITLISYIINELEKIYISSPSLHQVSYQKLIKCFSRYIPIRINANILNKECLDSVTEEIVSDKDSRKFDTEIKTYKV